MFTEHYDPWEPFEEGDRAKARQEALNNFNPGTNRGGPLSGNPITITGFDHATQQHVAWLVQSPWMTTTHTDYGPPTIKIDGQYIMLASDSKDLEVARIISEVRKDADERISKAEEAGRLQFQKGYEAAMDDLYDKSRDRFPEGY